jgi:hypothetical protein
MTALTALTALLAAAALARANRANRKAERIERFLTDQLLDEVDAFGWDDDDGTDTIPDWLRPPQDDQ